jgi:hypothetical protein
MKSIFNVNLAYFALRRQSYGPAFAAASAEQAASATEISTKAESEKNIHDSI